MEIYQVSRLCWLPVLQIREKREERRDNVSPLATDFKDGCAVASLFRFGIKYKEVIL